MRRFAFLGAAAALLIGAAVALAAASPTPSPSSAAHPSATPHPSTTTAPAAAPSASPSAAPVASPGPTSKQTFTAQVQPLQIGGSATVTETAAGGGTVTLRVTGLLDAQRWSVDIDGGTIASPNERIEIAARSGMDVTRLATDTVQVQLTKTEMAAFLKAQKAGGIVAVVTDGVRVGYAEFSAG